MYKNQLSISFCTVCLYAVVGVPCVFNTFELKAFVVLLSDLANYTAVDQRRILFYKKTKTS